MKQEIMEKLFNGKELSTEEILFVGKNLPDIENNTIPYDHENDNSLTACGFGKKDVDRVNRKFRELQENHPEKRVSKLVELVECDALADPLLLRMLVFQAIKAGTARAIHFAMGDMKDITDDMPDALKKLIEKIIRRKMEDDEEDSE